MTTPRLFSTGAIAQLWQRPVSVVERSLTAVGASPVFALNGIDYFDSVDADRALLRMIEEAKTVPPPPQFIEGTPQGTIEIFDADQDDDGDGGDLPDDPLPSNRLAKYLGTNHG